MSTHPHHTTVISEEQAQTWLDSQWEEEVVRRLPDQLEAQAGQLQAYRRVRQVKSATDLLRALLAYVLCASSFRRLGAWAVLVGLADICERGWRNRLRQATAWWLWLCSELIASPAPSDWLLARQIGRVLIVDATCIRQIGGTGDAWRLHTAYDLRAGRLCQVTITDRHGGEELAYDQLQAGDLVIADRGYGFRCSVALAAQQQAFVVLRCVLKSFPVEDEEGRAIDLLAWAQQTEEQVARCHCWYRWEGKRGQVRVIIRRLSDEQAGKARERMLADAKRKGKTVSERALKAAGWVWLATNLPAAVWREQDILRLYRGRWQIELVYKRMKHLLRMGQVRCHHPEMVEATIRLYLIAWALQEQEAAHIRGQLTEAAIGDWPPDALLSEPARQDEPVASLEEVSASLQAGEQVSMEGLAQPVAVTDPRLRADERAAGNRTSTQLYAGPIRTWLLTSLCLDLLTQQVRGYWSAARLRRCLPALQRFCGSSPRQRVHQETMRREWLITLRSGGGLQIQLLA